MLGEVVNLGSGFEISIGDVASLIASIMRYDGDIVCDNSRLRPQASEVGRLLADNTKAKEKLNWIPRYAGVEGLGAALEETVNWYMNRANQQEFKFSGYTV